MVRTIVTALYREIRGLHEAAYLLAIFAVVSQLLALVRDRLLASSFGAGTTLDVYYAAFRIPDFIFAGIASLVSFAVLMPFLAERVERSAKEARRFLSDIVFIFGVLIFSVSTIIFFAAPFILPKLFSGITSASAMNDLVLLTRILLIQPMLLGLSNIFAGVTQLAGRFAVYAIAPVLYNIGIIIGITLFYPLWGIAGLGWGVVLGAAFHFLVQTPILLRQKLFPRPTFPASWREIGHVFGVAIPRTLALSAQQLTLLALASIASLIQPGSIAVFHLAFNLHNVPLVIVGSSYSVAAFPTLARLFSRGNKNDFLAHVTIAARHIIFWSLPILALVVVLRAQIVRVILGAGSFDWSDTRLTAAALAVFIVSLASHGMLLLLVRAYYAAGRTLIPFFANLVGAAVSVGAALWLFNAFSNESAFGVWLAETLRVGDISGTAVLALPLGYSLGIIVAMTILLLRFQRDFHAFSRIHTAVFLQSAFAALGAGVTAHVVLRLLAPVLDQTTFIGIFLQGLGGGIAGITAAVILLYVTHSRELREVCTTLHRRFWKQQTAVAADEPEA